MIQIMEPGWLEHAIRQAMTEEAQKIVAEETEAAQLRVAERLGAMVDSLVLRVLSHYRIELRGHELIIRVDKRELTPPPA